VSASRIGVYATTALIGCPPVCAVLGLTCPGTGGRWIRRWIMHGLEERGFTWVGLLRLCRQAKA
jgi:hypothetical protein